MATDQSQVARPDELYSLPLDRFTAARDELARRLRAEGESEEAERVRRLTKPSVAAWALNRVARRDPQAVERLLESHRQLRRSDTVESLREASASRREAVAALVEAALGELGAAGRGVSPQTRDRILQTLLTVATDPEGEADLRAGRLVRELEPTGSGWGEIGLAPPPPAATGHRAEVVARQARERADRLEREAADAERRLELAQRVLAEARRRAKRARALADRAAEEARGAEEALE